MLLYNWLRNMRSKVLRFSFTNKKLEAFVAKVVIFFTKLVFKYFSGVFIDYMILLMGAMLWTVEMRGTSCERNWKPSADPPNQVKNQYRTVYRLNGKPLYKAKLGQK